MSWIDKDKRFLKKEEFLRIPTYNSYVTLDQEEKINVFLRFLKDMMDKYFGDDIRENSKPLKFLQSFIEKNKDVEDIYKFNLELEDYDILGLNKLILKDEVRKEYLKKNDSWDKLLDFEESIKNRKNNTNIDVLGENRLTREHFEIYALEHYEGNTELINKYLEFLDENFSIDRVNEVYNDYIISDLVNSLDDKIYEAESTIQSIEFGYSDSINEGLKIQILKGEIELYEDLKNFISGKKDKNEYILDKDLKIGGSFIAKGTSFFIEDFKDGKYGVHFEGNKNNIYKNDIGNGYYFDEFELSKMVDLTKIKELNGKEIKVYNGYLYKNFDENKKYTDNELYQNYEEWRTQRAEENQDKNNPFIWDCTEESARKDFSEFLGLKETITCDEMLGLEYKYEIGKIVNLSKEDYNLLGIEHPENVLKNIDNSNIELSKEQLNLIKNKSMNDLANEDREVFSYLIKKKTLDVFEKDIYEYYDAIDSIEKKTINEDIYSLIGANSLSKVIAENLEEKINRRIDILVDLGIDKNFNYDIAINKVNLNDNLNYIFADYLNEGVEIRHKDSLDEGQEIKSIKEFEDYAIDYLTPVSLDKNEEETNRRELENEIEKWNYKELLEFAQDNELNIEKVDKSIEIENDKEQKKGCLCSKKGGKG
ncbi:hypothetical protein ACV311_14120 [Clostridium perfringens]|uniref:hypothetical protein n=1 Tax=Clostridium perfringens TaxID=1502 RepID=UPI00155D9794|nr:hypothetical protein [Clostridium perfringens]MBI6029635.1 hypothetical protein [Clostridium perfringens]MBI6033012.1 hypothetical protein [Clostridium perfringens]MDV5113382.1 hypothetical protein [Clostridium perfringens]UUR88489.1 hypothetical protein NQ194_16045 [Clostridium perfringens]